jgi:hypothetical protein
VKFTCHPDPSIPQGRLVFDEKSATLAEEEDSSEYLGMTGKINQCRRVF